MAGLAVSLIRQQVAPNGWYRLRTWTTLGDASIWYAANAQCGKWLFAFGVAQVVIALATLLVPVLRDHYSLYAVVNSGISFIGTLIWGTKSVAYAENLPKERLPAT